MRIAAICLPELRVEVVRAADPTCKGDAREETRSAGSLPLAIVVASLPLTEAKLLGNTRLDVVSREARVLGVQPGQTIAQARARASDLAVRVVRPDAVHGVLARLAEVSLAFGATVSFATANEGADSYGDLVWVDVTGCAHLHGGEAVLGSRLAQVFAGLGHVCAVAIADGPRVAAILARAVAARAAADRARPASADRGGASDRRRREEDEDTPLVVVVPPGKNALALAQLPVSALPLGADDVRWLAKIGVRSIAELRALPRAALATRLGARAPVVLSLCEGEDRAPLAPYIPPEVPEEEAIFEYGVEGSEALTFVAKTLTDRLAARLAGRAVAASRIELDLALDVALFRDRLGDDRFRDRLGDDRLRADRIQRIAIELPQPLSGASDLLAALRPKIERVVLRAPVLSAKLRAAALVHKPQAALSLFEPQPKAERALPRLVAELAADLGEGAVGKLSLGDAWSPEDRSRFVRLGKATTNAGADLSGRKRRHMLSSVPEPTRVLGQPVPVPRDAVKVVRHLSRIEGVDWWKHIPGASREGGEVLKRGVDYVYAWVDEGAAWVEIDRASGAARIRGWFD